jgi:hypothetical protein
MAMALSVKRIQWWAGTIEDKAGGLSALLAPLAETKSNLEFVLARRAPEAPGKGVVFVAPVTTADGERAASEAGLKPAPEIAALRVEGPNQAGMGHAISLAIAEAGISFRGLAAVVIGERFVCQIAFDSAADANRAADIIGEIDPADLPVERKKEAGKGKR